MVCIIYDTRVCGRIPDGFDNVHSTDQDAPLSEREDTNSDGHPSFPFPESNAMEDQQPMVNGRCRVTYVLIIKDVEALAIVVLPATYIHGDEFIAMQCE